MIIVEKIKLAIHLVDLQRMLYPTEGHSFSVCNGGMLSSSLSLE